MAATYLLMFALAGQQVQFMSGFDSLPACESVLVQIHRAFHPPKAACIELRTKP